MSDLLVIMPPDWKEMQNFWIGPNNSPEEVQYWVDNADYVALESIAIEIGDMILGQHILAAQTIRVGGENKLYIKLAG